MPVSRVYRIAIGAVLSALSIPAIEAVFSCQGVNAAQVIKQELVTDVGFEVTTGESGNLFPSGPGIWDGDIFSTTGALSGVTPLEGSRMLRFEGLGKQRPLNPLAL